MALPPKIAAARKNAINELLTATTRETCSLDAINVYLQRLHKDLCPRAEPSRSKTVVDNALLSLSSLAHILNIASTRSELLDDVTSAVVHTLDGIIAWINYMLFYGLSIPVNHTPGADFRLAYFNNARVLIAIFNFSPRCRDALYASQAAIDLVYKIWVTTGKKEQVFQRLNIPHRPCPIVRLMTLCWKPLKGQRTFGKHAAAREKELSLVIISALVDRSRQVEKFVDGKGTIEDALSYFSALCDLATCIQEDIALQQIAVDKGLLEAMGKTAMTIIRKADASIGLRAIRSLMHTAVVPCAGKRVHNLQQVLIAGWIPSYLKFVQQQLSPDALKTAIATAGELEVMCCTHPEIPDLVSDILEPDSTIVDKLRYHPEEQFRIKWGDLLTALRWTTEVLIAVRGVKKPFIPEDSDPFRSRRGSTIINSCDYPSCPFVFSSKSSNARKCKGCKSVVYCSKSCQKQDWRARHRKECQPALLEFFRLSSEGTWYNHRTRAYHLDYIEKYCILVRNGHPSSLLTPAMIVDFRPGTAGAARLHSGLPDHETIFRAVTPPHIESRFNGLFGEMKQAMAGTLPDGKLVRFVEGIYPWVNGGFLSLLVKMKAPCLLPAKDMEFSVVYSVARIFYPNIQE